MARLDAAVAELVAALREELRERANGPDRLLSVDEAAATLGLGRSKVYAELATGRLRSLHIGDRRLVPAGAIRDYIASAAGVFEVPPPAAEGIERAPRRSR